MYRQLSWPERGRLWMRLGIRLILMGIFLFCLIRLLPPLLSLFAPFVAALILAALLNPLVRWVQRKLGWSRRLLSLLILLLLLALIGGMISLLVYYGGGELLSLAQNWEELLSAVRKTFERMDHMSSRILTLVPEQVTEQAKLLEANLLTWLQENLSRWATTAASYLGDRAMGVPAFFLALIVFLMATYFLTADYPYFKMRLAQHVDESVLDLMRQIRATAGTAFGGYLRAQLLLSIGVFIILCIGFFLTRQSYGLLLALALAVLDFIPIIGSGTVLVPWAIISLFTERFQTAIFMMLIWGGVVLFRRVAEPKIVGNQTGLSPILSLVSVYVGMKLAGVAGMIFGPILILILLNLAGVGTFDGIRADLSAAARDIAAILSNRPDDFHLF